MVQSKSPKISTHTAPLMTTDEAAAHLRLTVGALAQMRYSGTGPRFIKMGHLVRYRREEVEAWLDAQTREQTGAAH